FREWALIRRTAEVDIDILPGTFPNRIDPGDDGLIPVAILTTDEFDAALIDPLSVKFGPGGAPDSDGIGQIEDIDSDGDLDLVLSFSTQETGIQCGETSAALTGATFAGLMIEGSDTILTARC
ncbi:MAG TPA: hypothetical protein VJ768_01820, partial [Anaerolineales bacterium]|nr:hypothetical protein [Anaerolineales bacterium]